MTNKLVTFLQSKDKNKKSKLRNPALEVFEVRESFFKFFLIGYFFSDKVADMACRITHFSCGERF